MFCIPIGSPNYGVPRLWQRPTYQIQFFSFIFFLRFPSSSAEAMKADCLNLEAVLPHAHPWLSDSADHLDGRAVTHQSQGLPPRRVPLFACAYTPQPDGWGPPMPPLATLQRPITAPRASHPKFRARPITADGTSGCRVHAVPPRAKASDLGLQAGCMA